jgi:hypothetical protein
MVLFNSGGDFGFDEVKSTACGVSRPATVNSGNYGSKLIRHQRVIFRPNKVISPKTALAMFLCRNMMSRGNSGV